MNNLVQRSDRRHVQIHALQLEPKPFSLVLLLPLNLSLSWQNLSLLQNRESQEFSEWQTEETGKGLCEAMSPALTAVWTHGETFCFYNYFSNLSVKHISWLKSMLPWADFWPAHIATNQTNGVTPPATRLLKRPWPGAHLRNNPYL